MATYQPTLDVLVNPGQSTTYFDQSFLGRPLPPLDPTRAAYSSVNAWWLMEMSRLVYNIASDARRDALGTLHLREERFVDHPRIQYSLVCPADPGGTFAVVVFRGTHDPTDVVTDVDVVRGPWSGPGQVHSGFNGALDCVWSGLRAKLMNSYGGTRILFTGHSLGAALATLSAARWLQEGQPSLVYTFGSPRVGDDEFVRFLLRVPLYRVVDGDDAITKVPDLGYAHAGEPHPAASRYPGGGLVAEGLRLLKTLEGDWRGLLRGQDPDALLPEFLADHSPINYLADLEPTVTV